MVILVERLIATDLPENPVISAITLAELSAGPLIAVDDQARAVRSRHLQQAEAFYEALPFDSQAARAFGQVSASLRRSGRKVSTRSFDAMIAAVALANDLPLYTCNPSDFDGIDGLTVVAVPQRGVASA